MKYIITWFIIELISGILTFAFIFLLLYLGEVKKDNQLSISK